MDRKGVVESAASYLDAPLQERKLPAGLGARHAAAAGITMTTDALAVVVSASSRRVTLFSEGEIALELDVAVKPVAIHK